MFVAVTSHGLFAADLLTIESLLSEMVERVARYPTEDFRLKQASSYDCKSKSPDAPKGWFANFDRSTNDIEVKSMTMTS